MRLYVNVWGDSPMGADLAQVIGRIGFEGVRRDVLSAEGADGLCGDLAGTSLHPILLVGSGDLGKMQRNGAAMTPREIADLAGAAARAAKRAGLFDREPPAAIELGNEPNIASAMYANDARRFGELLRIGTQEVMSVSDRATVISGGIWKTSQSALDYLAKALDVEVPEACHVGYHPYREESEPEVPSPGFGSRDAEFQKLKAIAAGRPIWCTECGWHTGLQPRYLQIWKWKLKVGTFQYRDVDVAAFTQREVRLNWQHGARGYVFYQLFDGPTPNSSDRFGILRYPTETRELKPVADVIRPLVAEVVGAPPTATA